jgi:hypothetical protein
MFFSVIMGPCFSSDLEFAESPFRSSAIAVGPLQPPLNRGSTMALEGQLNNWQQLSKLWRQ